MPDPVEPVAAPAPAVTQGNDPAARTETGEIKDVQANPVPATTEPAKEPVKEPAKVEAGIVPEKYEFKAPEGQVLNEALIVEATPLFKELGLSQEGAQKLFDFHNKAMADLAAAPMKAYEELREVGRKEIIADKTLGDGKADLKPEVKANIAKAIDSLPNAKEFRDAMNLTGAGDNPAFARAVNYWGAQLAEGTAVRGSGPSPAGQVAPGKADHPSPAQAMYPSLPSSAS